MINNALRALALAAITSLFFVETAIADQKAFSQPTTPPEKALHAILQWHTQHFEDKQLHAFLTPQNRKGAWHLEACRSRMRWHRNQVQHPVAG